MFVLNDEMIDEINSQPNFLRVTPEGFDDGCEVQTEMTCTVLDAATFVKVFEANKVVHTSDDCGSDPQCPRCKGGHKYLRLRIEVDGREFQLDLSKTNAPRFIALARNGIDGLLHMTCIRKERNGMVWGDIAFEVVGREAA
jgi:hypothetical protein